MNWFSKSAAVYKSAWNRSAAEHVILEFDNVDEANKGIAEMAALGYEPAGVSRIGDTTHWGAAEAGVLDGTLGVIAASSPYNGKIAVMFGFSDEVLEYHEVRRQREGREFEEQVRKYLRIETDRTVLEGIEGDLAPEFRVLCEQRLADLTTVPI
jgi:hypothetical protein